MKPSASSPPPAHSVESLSALLDQVAGTGLSLTDCRVLLTICQTPGISPSEIGRQRGRTPQNINSAGSKLAFGGHIEIHSDPDNRRNARYFPTKQGRELVKKLLK
jgi:DNA-binding MarR family transcriptional regulator